MVCAINEKVVARAFIHGSLVLTEHVFSVWVGNKLWWWYWSWLYFSHSGSEKVKSRKLFYWQVHVQLSLDFVWFLHHVISILYYMGMTIYVMLVTFCQKRNTFPALTKPLMFVFYACHFSKIFEIQCGNIWWALRWIMIGHIYLFVTLLVYMLLLIHFCLIFFNRTVLNLDLTASHSLWKCP